MANVKQAIKRFFGWGVDDMEEEEHEEAEEITENPVQVVSPRPRRQPASGNVISVRGKADINDLKLIVYKPINYEDAVNIIGYLRKKRQVIVNMEKLNRDVAQRILDVVFGAICAVDGKLYKVNGRIYVVSPAGGDVIGSDLEY